MDRVATDPAELRMPPAVAQWLAEHGGGRHHVDDHAVLTTSQLLVRQRIETRRLTRAWSHVGSTFWYRGSHRAES